MMFMDWILFFIQIDHGHHQDTAHVHEPSRRETYM